MNMDTIAKTITSAVDSVTKLVTSAVGQAPVPAPAAQAPAPAPARAKPKYNHPKQIGIYSTILITRSIPVNIINVGNNIKQTLEKAISLQIEGKCTVDGYIKPNSTKILTYSSGLVNGPDIVFEVTFECLVCSPVEGMHIKCIVKNITKAGIRAETNEDPSPVVIFVARDHHYNQEYFSTVKENDDIKVRVIGQRFELNDKYISVIAELLEPKEDRYKAPTFTSAAAKKPIKLLPSKLKQSKLIITD
jgi:DNA-directed RNA polymerase subunit E'/Rpb7